jgi:hypothetical protein
MLKYSENKGLFMDNFIKKHVDTVVILGGIISSILWMNGKFNDVDEKFFRLTDRLYSIENRVTKIETVLIMKSIYPSELSCSEKITISP